jgi:putative lipoic acid-binding regulatory protein
MDEDKQDPIDAATDTEYVQGNILNALLTFPVSYTFHVVGKTSGDETLQSTFVQQVKDVVKNTNTNDDDPTYHITPRGAKYTKVSIEKQVLNSEEIALIYTQLSNLELSVMQF